jgi:flagellar biosynthesis/type III secretory pathway protein FliH
VAVPIFARLRFELPQDPADRTEEEEELAMNSQQIVEALEREATERGVAQGMAQGVAKGAADLAAHHVERRLGRKLREDERACIRERIETLGPERVGDLVLDLSVDELAAWLADPNAR